MATFRAALAQVFPGLNGTGNANMSDSIGRKDDTAVIVSGTTKSSLAYLKGLINQVASAIVSIGLIKTETDKTPATIIKIDDILAETEIIERHLHLPDKWYGNYMGGFKRCPTTMGTFQTVAANNDFGPEEIIYDPNTDDVISGTTFDAGKMKVMAVGTANKSVFIEFGCITYVATVAATTDVAADTIVKNAHGLINGTLLTVDTIASTTGLLTRRIYRVVNKTDNTFQVALIAGGTFIALAGSNGTLNYNVVTRTVPGENIISRTSATPDTFTSAMNFERISTAKRMSCRSHGNTATNTVDYYLGIHSY
jgi:hypothetical protein